MTMQIKEIMTEVVNPVNADATVRQAAAEMSTLDVGFLPVTVDGRVIGTLTDRDIAVRAVAEGRDPKTTLVRDVMTKDVVSLTEDTAVEEAARVMEQRKVRRLLVEDQERRLVGVISLGDLAVEGRDPRLSGEVVEKVSRPGR